MRAEVLSILSLALNVGLNTWPIVNEVQEARRYCNPMRDRERERERERERDTERDRRTIDNRKYALIFDARTRHHLHPTECWSQGRAKLCV